MEGLRKTYIWQTRELCINCYRARVNLEKSLVECRQLWQSEKNKILADSQLVIRHPHQCSEFLIRPDIFLERIAHEVNRKQHSARDSRRVASITSILLFAASRVATICKRLEMTEYRHGLSRMHQIR
jgi:hypothetical protein